VELVSILFSSSSLSIFASEAGVTVIAQLNHVISSFLPTFSFISLILFSLLLNQLNVFKNVNNSRLFRILLFSIFIQVSREHFIKSLFSFLVFSTASLFSSFKNSILKLFSSSLVNSQFFKAS